MARTTATIDDFNQRVTWDVCQEGANDPVYVANRSGAKQVDKTFTFETPVPIGATISNYYIVCTCASEGSGTDSWNAVRWNAEYNDTCEKFYNKTLLLYEASNNFTLSAADSSISSVTVKFCFNANTSTSGYTGGAGGSQSKSRTLKRTKIYMVIEYEDPIELPTVSQYDPILLSNNEAGIKSITALREAVDVKRQNHNLSAINWVTISENSEITQSLFNDIVTQASSIDSTVNWDSYKVSYGNTITAEQYNNFSDKLSDF